MNIACFVRRTLAARVPSRPRGVRALVLPLTSSGAAFPLHPELFCENAGDLIIVMHSDPSRHRVRRAHSLFLFLLFIPLVVPPVTGAAQQLTPASHNSSEHHINSDDRPWFRIERTEVAGGAEILTVFGNLQGLRRDAGANDTEVPLVSILRDTLGDTDEENDRLRDVWMLTYTRPTFVQRVASAVPFFFARVGNKKRAGKGAPPAVIDLSQSDDDVWRRFLWLALRNVFINPYGVIAKSSSRALLRNADEYRKAHVIRALAVLTLYESEADVESVFTPTEMREIQARLMLTQMTFGGIVDDGYLQRVYQNQNTSQLDERGHNWELLRQRAEAEGLYFDPLEMPDGSTTHAMLWAARSDLTRTRTAPWNKRFLNIANPWGDKELLRWQGYTEIRYFDADNRAVPSETPGARAVEMIPLALYGLDNPKIPTLLIDFRDGGNPKRREMSRRVLEDVARDVLSLSRFGDIHYFLGRTVFDFVTGRRGMDINQPRRIRAYSQLKLLLSLSASLDPEFRNEISRRVEQISLNPLENDLAAEARLARQQYAALMTEARRPGGLPAKLDRDRRAELVPTSHGRTTRIMFRVANVASLGLYTHREQSAGPQRHGELDTTRRLAYHRRFLREVAKSSPVIEVVWDTEEVHRSLRYVAEHGRHAGTATASAAARVFARTNDEETRRLALNCLYRINNETAKKELLRISLDPVVESSWRTISAEYLRLAIQEEQRIAPSDIKAIVSVIGQ
ncbi:MAG: hypothetical protein H0W76_07340 [Pyrinomonadaceae bacterium]|nr:hypothetical protein [Pyrinomonadaceae bacterium]